MAESILEHGIIQPPIARLVEECEDTQRVEIVFGQRRYLGAVRAQEMAFDRGMSVEDVEDLGSIPLIVRGMSDRQVVEEAWVENLQRVDVSVREESEGFDSLLALRDDDGEPVYTQASLAKKLGKSVAFLSQRLKLRHVPEVLWTALDERRVSVRHLERVGTVADPKAREKLAQEILAPKYQSEPLSTRQTEELIEAEYRKSLKGVVWDAADAELVPIAWSGSGLRLSGGSCEDCPHRTGNVPELQDGLQRTAGIGKGSVKGIDPRVCLLPSCHRAKEEAHWARLAVDAEAGGLRVLSDGEAAKVFREWGGDFALMPGSPFVAVASKPGYSETGHHGQDDLPTWEELLAGTGYE